MEQEAVIIFGATGLGKVALEVFNSRGIMAYCFLDDDESLHQQEINNVVVMGHTKDDGYLKFIGKKCQAFVAIEDMAQRKKIVSMLQDRRKTMPMNAIHDACHVSETAFLGYGNFINVGAVINPYAKVPNHCIIHAQAVLDYEAELGDYVQIGAGAIVSARAKIGEGAVIGAGAVIASGIQVGKNAQVAPGAVVLQNVKAKELVFGNPATSA